MTPDETNAPRAELSSVEKHPALTAQTDTEWPSIAAVIVTYKCADFIGECLESVFACGYPNLKVVVVENASPDETGQAVASWAATSPALATLGETKPLETRQGGAAQEPLRAPITLLALQENLGFAGGVNAGLVAAMRAGGDNGGNDLFWILNPDTVVEPQTPFALAKKAREMGRFAVIGGRVLYFDEPDRVQTDGGRIHRLGCTAISVNIGADAATVPMPNAPSLRYIPGVSMLASREFLDTAGLMPERWFLYFEEIDWQLARGDLPLGLTDEARVLHRAGGSIGSGAIGRRPSPFSVYFTCRNIMPFAFKWFPLKAPFAYLMAYYKLLTQWGLAPETVSAALRGLHGLGPQASVRARLPDSTWAKILGHKS